MIRFLPNLFGMMLLLFSVKAGEVLVIGTADLHGDLANLSRLASQIKRYPDAIKIDTGDFAQGDFVCANSGGLPVIDAFNELKYDLLVPGNHEFEFTPETFYIWRERFAGKILGMQWRFGDFVPEAWSIIERNGYRIGIVGMGESGMRKRAEIFSALQWQDEIDLLRKLMPEIRKAKCDVLLLVAHTALKGNFGELYTILQKFPEFDAVIAAHSHREHPGSIVAKKIASQPGAFGKSAVLLRFCFDENKKLVQIKSQLLRGGQETDSKILEIYSLAKKEVGHIGQEKLGSFSSPDEFGKFCADGICKYFQCDAAFFSMNKKYFTPGWMTGESLFRLMPYGNRICIVRSNGRDLEKLAEKLTNPRRQIYSAGKFSGDNIQVAMSEHLFLMYQKMAKERKYHAETVGVFERDAVIWTLKKDLNKNIVE